jgi:hypothetical protein
MDFLQQHLIDADLVGEKVYVDTVPDRIELPYILLEMDVGQPSVLSGDGRTLARRSTHQVHVFQAEDSHDGPLAQAVRDTIDGFKGAAGGSSYRYRVEDVFRYIERDLGIVRHAVLVTVVFMQ